MSKRLTAFIVLLFLLGTLSALRIGYAFSGGGARGLAHIGMLKVMEEAGIRPQYISGTSIGALVGGLYAIGYSPAEIESIFVNTDWNTIFSDGWNREDLYIGQKRWAPFGNATFRLDESWRPQLPQSVITGNRINLELFRLFTPASGISDFSKLPVPFSAIATDLVSGKMQSFTTGNLLESIRASMSIPSILQPFPLNNTLYIDGGISQNLPCKQVREMGSDFVIGFKVNSSLQSRDKLQDLIKVLDQTINIGITNRLNEEISNCDNVLDPDLSDFSATNFRNVKAIIKAGEDYTRNYFDDLVKLAQIAANPDDSIKSRMHMQRNPTYRFKRIAIQGAQNLSPYNIREYLGLETDNFYNTDDIIRGINQAWNSQMFDLIYPVIEQDSTGYLLNIIVREKERKSLIMNFTYDRENGFVAGTVLSLQNYLMKNSTLLAEVKLGGKNELNIDLVRNFGQAYGVYYRVFPYLNEKRIYFYDDNHNRQSSVRSLESGLTCGVGLFARKTLVCEAFGFTSSTRYYREISTNDLDEGNGKSSLLSGIGFKAYHESLDDYYFPCKGTRASGKLTFSRDDILSDQSINKLNLDYAIYRPVSRSMSTQLGINVGSHFRQDNQSNLDPFYLGGLENFAGLPRYEKSAPFFELIQAGLTAKPFRNSFLTVKAQALNYADENELIPDTGILWGGVLELGYKSYLGPIKLAMAVSEHNKSQVYLAVGYTQDIFHFSRR